MWGELRSGPGPGGPSAGGGGAGGAGGGIGGGAGLAILDAADGGGGGGAVAVAGGIGAASDDPLEDAFARKLAKFEAADAHFRALSDRLKDYRAAMVALANAGVALADAVSAFFGETPHHQRGTAGAGSGPGVAGAASCAHPHAALPAAFRAAARAVHARAEKEVLPRLDDEVMRPVRACLDQFPEVRSYIKQRNAAHAELQKRTKRLGSAGVGFGLGAGLSSGGLAGTGGGSIGVGVGGGSGPGDGAYGGHPGISSTSSVTMSGNSAGSSAGAIAGLGGGGGGVAGVASLPGRMRDRDRQRKVREVSDRYKMFDDQVMQRFSYIDRTQPALVLPPLRRLAALLHDFARTSATTLGPVAEMATADAPPLTRDVPSPPWCENTTHHSAAASGGAASWSNASGLRDRRYDQHGGGTSSNNNHDGEEEGWDDAFDFDDASAGGRGHDAAAVTDVAAPASAPPVPSVRAAPGTNEDVDGRSDPRRVKSAGPSTSDAALGIPTVKTSRNNPVSAPAGLAQSDDKAENWDQDSRSERQSVLMRLCALHDYKPLETNELPLHVGDIIEVYEKHHSGWWHGRANHTTGYFPRVYARELTEQEEVDYLNERSRRRKERRRGHRRRESHDSRRSILSASQTSIPAVSSGPTSPERAQAS